MRLALLLGLIALTLQVAMLDGFAWLWETAYGEPRAIAERHEQPLTLLGLVAGGPVALLLGVSAFYRALNSSGAGWKRMLLCSALLPALFLAVVACHCLACLCSLW